MGLTTQGRCQVQQLTSHVFLETQVKGCNFGLVTTSDGIVMIDSPHKPSDAMRLKAEIARRGQLRYIINTEPHGDYWTGNVFFQVPVIAHEGVRRRILDTDLGQAPRVMRMNVASLYDYLTGAGMHQRRS